MATKTTCDYCGEPATKAMLNGPSHCMKVVCKSCYSKFGVIIEKYDVLFKDLLEKKDNELNNITGEMEPIICEKTKPWWKLWK